MCGELDGAARGAMRIGFFDDAAAGRSLDAGARARGRRARRSAISCRTSVADYIVAEGLYGASTRGERHVSGSRPGAGPDQGEHRSEELADRIAEIASDRKAIDIRVLDLRGTWWATRTSSWSARATPSARPRRSTTRSTRSSRTRTACCPAAPRAPREARWILLDYLDCVVHIFTPEAREFYRLENLWGDAPQRTVD